MLDERALDDLLASVGGDRAFVVELIEAYLADGGAQLDAIEVALASDDADSLVRPAHTLKSSSATVGGMSLSGMARTLELAGRAGDLHTDEARAAAADLRSTWEATTAALKAWIVADGG